MQLVGWWRSIKLRVHGEHGWDINDLKGQNWKYKFLKKVMKRFIHKYIALSKEATNYITNVINVDAKKVNRICNGVDTNKFDSLESSSIELPSGFIEKDSVVFGTVGRLALVKNQGLLLEAFILLVARFPEQAHNLKLLIVGDGILMKALTERCEQAKLTHNVCLFGNSNNVNEILRCMDVFVLPSLAEGISNTFLEAMATGLPVIATNVGGNPDLMMPEHASTHLIAIDDVESMAISMQQYIINSEKLADDSRGVRQYCVDNFGIDVMVDKYHRIYQSVNG
jgi:sugar transferase (PEP-CTERM/EpsH1 system associated)